MHLLSCLIRCRITWLLFAGVGKAQVLVVPGLATPLVYVREKVGGVQGRVDGKAKKQEMKKQGDTDSRV